jgi:2-oxoglutarate ferredoxin oxidoreductase subunit beta
VKKAFQNQIDGKGFSLVEIMTVCPTYGAKSMKEAYKMLDEKVIPYYPLGVIKDEDNR